jgi:tRNA A37 threonylcarbamoyladenosine synthetase subunit TsaC/SUA5/YrdC
MYPPTKHASLAVTASWDALRPVARILEDGGIAAVSWGHPRRATYALLTRADDRAATTRLNHLKGRPPDQVLAVVGATDVARKVADLTLRSAVARQAAARRLGTLSFLDQLYGTGPVALMLEAREDSPPAVVKRDDSGKARVLVVGRSPAGEPENFYDELVRYLAVERGVVVAGTSGNRSKKRTYTARDHEEAEADFGGDVDAFVRPNLPIPAPRGWDAAVSCTGFDLTGSEPTLIRHGSLHPDVFRRTLELYEVSPSVERIGGRQGAWAGMIERVRRAH